MPRPHVRGHGGAAQACSIRMREHRVTLVTFELRTLSSYYVSRPLHPPLQQYHHLGSDLHPPDVMSGWHSAPRREPSFTLPPKHDRSRDMIVPGMHHARSPEPVSDPRLHTTDRGMVRHSRDKQSPAWLPPKVVIAYAVATATPPPEGGAIRVKHIICTCTH